jgi:hypothetical protein
MKFPRLFLKTRIQAEKWDWMIWSTLLTLIGGCFFSLILIFHGQRSFALGLFLGVFVSLSNFWGLRVLTQRVLSADLGRGIRFFWFFNFFRWFFFILSCWGFWKISSSCFWGGVLGYFLSLLILLAAAGRRPKRLKIS